MEVGNDDTTVAVILRSLSPLERWLWGWFVRRVSKTYGRTEYRDQVTRFGEVGAMHLQISGTWRLLGILIGFLSLAILIPGQLQRSGTLELASAPVWTITIACFVMSSVRIYTARTYKKAFRREQAERALGPI